MIAEWGQRLGRRSCPYVRRWMIQTRFGSVRLHHWTGPDDFRASHDHPWWFLTLVLWGGYTDRNFEGDDALFAPALRFRRASHRHRVVPLEGGCWTLVLTGPAKRGWGFFLGNRTGRIDADEYGRLAGEAPCAPPRSPLGDRYGLPR